MFGRAGKSPGARRAVPRKKAHRGRIDSPEWGLIPENNRYSNGGRTDMRRGHPDPAFRPAS
jgi:hypothetical protein